MKVLLVFSARELLHVEALVDLAALARRELLLPSDVHVDLYLCVPGTRGREILITSNMFPHPLAATGAAPDTILPSAAAAATAAAGDSAAAPHAPSFVSVIAAELDLSVEIRVKLSRVISVEAGTTASSSLAASGPNPLHREPIPARRAALRDLRRSLDVSSEADASSVLSAAPLREIGPRWTPQSDTRVGVSHTDEEIPTAERRRVDSAADTPQARHSEEFLRPAAGVGGTSSVFVSLPRRRKKSWLSLGRGSFKDRSYGADEEKENMDGGLEAAPLPRSPPLPLEEPHDLQRVAAVRAEKQCAVCVIGDQSLKGDGSLLLVQQLLMHLRRSLGGRVAVVERFVLLPLSDLQSVSLDQIPNLKRSDLILVVMRCRGVVQLGEDVYHLVGQLMKRQEIRRRLFVVAPALKGEADDVSNHSPNALHPPRAAQKMFLFGRFPLYFELDSNERILGLNPGFESWNDAQVQQLLAVARSE